MSYKALYRKYRPQIFEEVVGQDYIVTTLQNIINSKKVSHAYLFSGPRGTGKTSVAHIFAREINRTASGDVAIGDLDVIEIDAASNNGVSEVRNIIDNSKYAPTNAKYKVYIIDEVHMLTKGAFNALLKTLEEPPERVVFILATTEPHKIPVTILSRTQRFNFRRIDDNIIKNQLSLILDKENIKYEDTVLSTIARISKGGMRDALSIADQASAYESQNISFTSISQVFGIISIGNQIKLLNYAYMGEAKKLIQLIDELIENGVDLERLTSSLTYVLKDFIFYGKTNDLSLIDYLNEKYISNIQFDIDYAYKAIEEIIKLSSVMKFSSIPRQMFELALLKLTTERPINIKEPGGQKPIIVSSPQNNIVKETQQVEPPQVETSKIKEETLQDKSPNEKEPDLEENETSSEEVPNIFEDVEQGDTDEFNIIDEIENESESQEIDEHILTTQEIPLNELSQTETPTDEIDLVSMFQPTSNEVEANDNKVLYSVDEIINLLLQANKDYSTSYKEKLMDVYKYESSTPDPHYIKLLQEVKFISAGKHFLLVSSEDETVIKQLHQEINKEQFKLFITSVFGEPINFYAITKIEFDEVKQMWGEYKLNNSFPKIKEIQPPMVKKQEKTEAQMLGEDIFGELFK